MNGFENRIDIVHYIDNIDIILKTKLNKLKLDEKRKIFLKNKTYWQDEHTQFQLYLEKYFNETMIVAVPDEISLEILQKINTLHIPNNKYKLTPMQQSLCHDNCDNLYALNNELNIFIGYALSCDRLWRFHSWCVDNNGNIIETTCARLLYLGYDRTPSKYKCIL